MFNFSKYSLNKTQHFESLTTDSLSMHDFRIKMNLKSQNQQYL